MPLSSVPKESKQKHKTEPNSKQLKKRKRNSTIDESNWKRQWKFRLPITGSNLVAQIFPAFLHYLPFKIDCDFLDFIGLFFKIFISLHRDYPPEPELYSRIKLVGRINTYFVVEWHSRPALYKNFGPTSKNQVLNPVAMLILFRPNEIEFLGRYMKRGSAPVFA